MKKSFQIIKVEVPRATTSGNKITPGQLTVTEQLRQDYAKCTGIFVMPEVVDVVVNPDTDNQFKLEDNISAKLNNVTGTLKIAGNEILPVGFDLSLLAFTGRMSMEQTTYDFSRENIPARSSDLEFVIENRNLVKKVFTVYLQLEN